MKNILISILFVTASLVGYSQEVITGTVSSNEDGLLVGVNVVVKGSESGVMTDFDGKFTIQANPNDILVFSYIGYLTKEVNIGNQTNLEILMEIDVTVLDEVVITGFQRLSKERVVGSVTTMNSDDLDKIVTPNLLDKIEGQLAGVDIKDGKIVIRGQNTFNTGQTPEFSEWSDSPDARGVELSDGTVVSYRDDPSAPLVVLDGFPFEGDVNDIDPNDVENITVLKDASSLSVWGTKAANGVIVITRKSGGKKGLSATYSSQLKVSDRPDFSDYNYASSSQALDMERYALDVLGRANLLGSNANGAPFTAVEEIYYKRNNLGTLSYPEAEYLLDELRLKSNYNEAADAFLRNEFVQNHSLQIRNVGEIITNTFSVNYTGTNSSRIGDKNTKIGLSLRNNIKLTDWLKLDLNYTANIEDREGNSMASSFLNGKIRPYEDFRTSNGDYAPMYYERYGKPFYMDDEYRAKGYFPWHYNVLEEQEHKSNETASRTDILQFNAGIDLIDGLKFNSTFQYQMSKQEIIQHSNPNTYLSRNMVNKFTTAEEITPGVYTRENHVPMGGGFRQEVSMDNNVIDFRNQLSYEKNLTEDHFISVLLGTEYNDAQKDYKTRSIIGYNPVTGTHGTTYVNLLDLTYDSQTESSQYTFNNGTHKLRNFINSNGFNNYINFGTYGILGYAFKNKYNVSTSFRVDQSNLFKDAGKNTIWSVGGSWTISKEDFFSNLADKINNLRLRGSFGYTGNVDRSAIPFLKGKPDFYIFSGIENLTVSEPSNPALKMEKTRNINIGLELGILQNKYSIEIDYYNNLSENLIVEQRTDPTSKGWSTGKLNNGSLQNTGLDITINANPVDGPFSWNTSLNFAYNKNEVVDYEEDNTANYFRDLIGGGSLGTKATGFDVNHITSYNYQGLDENGAATILVNGNVINPNVHDETPLTYWYGYELVEMDDLVYHGSSDPLAQGGFYNSFSYKNFVLGINALYQFGHYFRRPFVDIQVANAISTIPNKDIVNAWSQPGDENITDIPRLTASDQHNLDPYFISIQALYNNVNWFKYASSRVEKADNIRISYINLGYHLPDEVLKSSKLGIKSLQFNAQVENILLWTKNKFDLDPRYLNRPNPRQYTFGLIAKF